MWLTPALLAALAVVLPNSVIAQDDPNDTPLGDVARNFRKKTPASQEVIDNDNFSHVMDQVESKHAQGASLKFLMAGEGKGFQVSAPDVTCSLSFSANTKSLLSSQYAQMELPPTDVARLEGPATIEGDALTVSVFNNTDWHVSEVAVALTIVKKNEPEAAPSAGLASENEVRPEKKRDVTVIYRMRAAAPPSATTVFSAPLNFDLAAGDEWHWAIVQAKGYPPQGYAGSSVQATVQDSPARPAQPAVSPALLPQDSPAASLSQNPQ